jgi:DNA-binding HxlR family transcriptional regulator
MLKAQILRVLSQFSREGVHPTFAQVKDKMDILVHDQILFRYLQQLVEHGLVRTINTNPPRYGITKTGIDLVYLIEYLDTVGREDFETLAPTPYYRDLVNTALELKILEVKRGLVRYVTSGCGVEPIYHMMLFAGNDFMPVKGIDYPKYVKICQKEFTHVGGGDYIPKELVKEKRTLFDFLPALLGGLAPIAAVVGTIVACELSKGK